MNWVRFWSAVERAEKASKSGGAAILILREKVIPSWASWTWAVPRTSLALPIAMVLRRAERRFVEFVMRCQSFSKLAIVVKVESALSISS